MYESWGWYYCVDSELRLLRRVSKFGVVLDRVGLMVIKMEISESLIRAFCF